MTETDVEKAVTNFNDDLNCCQAILLAYGGLLGLARESAIRLGTGFGGGIAHHGEVCGAVTGAVIAINIKYGMTKKSDEEARYKTFELISEFITEFKEQHKSIRCIDLLGCDISTEEGQKQAQTENMFDKICPEFVRTAAMVLEKKL